MLVFFGNLAPQNVSEERFNAVHVLTRSDIERRLGVVKKRFYSLQTLPLLTSLVNSKRGIGENHREQDQVNSEDAPAVPTCSQPKRLSLPGPYGLAHCRGETRCLTPTARVVSFEWQRICHIFGAQKMIRDTLIIGLADEDIRLDVLGQADQDMSIDNAIRFIEAKESGKRAAVQIEIHALPSDAKDLGIDSVLRSPTSTANTQAIADTGCQSCLAGPHSLLS
ncbi:hypothetical protein RRG08_054572 [Elysia crispata]|uniref:Uncharacterized protein n=1 Tax=Elysia crispata TaxID=231223 RepID=A0AAE1B0W9_9GAST|nr:hypothetical protein RRG08_054572 [Elysia crispata]